MSTKLEWENKLRNITEEKNEAGEEFQEIKIKYEEIKNECGEMNQRNKVITYVHNFKCLSYELRY